MLCPYTNTHAYCYHSHYCPHRGLCTISRVNPVGSNNLQFWTDIERKIDVVISPLCSKDLIFYIFSWVLSNEMIVIWVSFFDLWQIFLTKCIEKLMADLVINFPPSLYSFFWAEFIKNRNKKSDNLLTDEKWFWSYVYLLGWANKYLG